MNDKRFDETLDKNVSFSEQGEGNVDRTNMGYAVKRNLARLKKRDGTHYHSLIECI